MLARNPTVRNHGGEWEDGVVRGQRYRVYPKRIADSLVYV